MIDKIFPIWKRQIPYFPLWKRGLGGFTLIITYLIILSISECSYFALFSPEVALDKYHRVGVINFTSESKGNLNQILTQMFLKDICKATKKALIIELGDEAKLLELVNEKEMNPAAIIGIAKKHDLDGIVTGKTVIHDVNPQIKVIRSSAVEMPSGKPPIFTGSGYRGMRAKFDIDASLSVNLIDTKSVINVWSNSAREKKTVTPVNTYPVKGTFGVFFDEKTSEEAHKGLSDALVQDIIHKLRVKHL